MRNLDSFATSVLCCLSALGPYLVNGKNSDAKITEHMLKSNSEGIINWFSEWMFLLLGVQGH